VKPTASRAKARVAITDAPLCRDFQRSRAGKDSERRFGATSLPSLRGGGRAGFLDSFSDAREASTSFEEEAE